MFAHWIMGVAACLKAKKAPQMQPPQALSVPSVPSVVTIPKREREPKCKEAAMGMDPFTGQVIGLAIDVHRALGPGLLESTYQQCLAHELRLYGIPFQLEHPLPVEYKGVRLDCGYRIDLLVDDRLILELKAVEAVSGIHRAQLLTYMKLSGITTGLLINFNVQRLADGIERFKL